MQDQKFSSLFLTIYTTGSAARSDNAATLNVSNFTGFTVETWIAFISADDTEAANIIYMGELTIS